MFEIKILSFLLNYLENKNNSVLFWNGKNDKENFKTYIFIEPAEIIKCFNGKNIKYKLLKLEEKLKKGYYIAGFISYEAGLIFEELVSFKTNFKFPVIWFGVYKKPLIFDHRKKRFMNNNKLNQQFKKYNMQIKNDYCIKDIKPNLEKKKYIKNIQIIKNCIEEGNTYQVNYTFKHKFNFKGKTENLFYNLCLKQSVAYASFIKTKDKDILSLSPELFFRRNKNNIYVKPMKGTIDRGINYKEDNIKEKKLQNSIKNRAENVMIVDLLRNDLGRISKTGSVKVNKLFEVEKYETLFQMTSTIKSELKSGISWYEIFKNIFPSGSVTGAPKISTMKIINDLEKEPRHIYTGSIGYITPDNKSVFNVSIRTVLIDKKTQQGEMGIGSGIVYDSDENDEYEECLLKSKFLTDKHKEFKLIETILWEKGNLFLLDLHLNRLQKSAKYFNFKYNKLKIIKNLYKKCKKFDYNKKYKIRLLLDIYSNISIISSQLDKQKKVKIKFSNKKTNPKNIVLYHKTTNRKFYDKELEKARKEGFFDVIFINKKEEITEGCISNIIIKKNNVFYTPPVKCGLLNGVYRQFLLEKEDFPLQEKILTKQDIFNADKVYLINSVRKIRKVSYIA